MLILQLILKRRILNCNNENAYTVYLSAGFVSIITMVAAEYTLLFAWCVLQNFRRGKPTLIVTLPQKFHTLLTVEFIKLLI